MKSQFNFRPTTELCTKTLQTFICIALVVLVSGCASVPESECKLFTSEDKNESEKEEIEVKEFDEMTKHNSDKHKSIFVFLDGTGNDPRSVTNVWRLSDRIQKNEDPQQIAIYIWGVGTFDKPVTGQALGRGMQEQILKGYKYITKNYNPGDDIYIFGFSRGALAARSLAGLLAYAGVPVINDSYMSTGGEILKRLRQERDEDYLEKWKTWKLGQSLLFAADIKQNLKLEMQAVEITFLGLWDTVPGSQFKNYGLCKEKFGFWKTYFYWLPLIDKGERYKTNTYPPIRQIAHAVSKDEKRSKFAPLLLCPEINSDYTKKNEMWFPGAHADVGGGYEDCNISGDSKDLPGISLNWMIGLLAEKYKFNTAVSEVKEDAKGLAHWSFGDNPGNIGSDCVKRTPPSKYENDEEYKYEPHPSIKERMELAKVPILVKGELKELQYPKKCEKE